MALVKNISDNTTRAALIVNPPILLCWPTVSEENVGGMAVEADLSTNILLNFIAM